MMELVDMLDSKSGVCKDVGVQVPLWVMNKLFYITNGDSWKNYYSSDEWYSS